MCLKTHSVILGLNVYFFFFFFCIRPPDRMYNLVPALTLRTAFPALVSCLGSAESGGGGRGAGTADGTGLPCEVAEKFWNQTVVRVAQGCEDSGSTGWSTSKQQLLRDAIISRLKEDASRTFRRWLPPLRTLVGGIRGSLGAADLSGWSLSRPTEAALWGARVNFPGDWRHVVHDGTVEHRSSGPTRSSPGSILTRVGWFLVIDL